MQKNEKTRRMLSLPCELIDKPILLVDFFEKKYSYSSNSFDIS